MKTKKKTRKTTKRGRPILWTVLAAAVVLLLFFTLIVVGLLFNHDPKYPTIPMESVHVTNQTKILNRIIPVVMKSQPDDIAEINLTEDEVNSIIRFIDNSGNLIDFFSRKNSGKKRQTQNYRATFQQGRFNIAYAVETGISNPFGSCIIFKVIGKPVITETDQYLDLDSAKLGDLPLPAEQAETIFKAIIDSYRNDDAFKQIRNIIVKANVTAEGHLLIVYRPYKLRNYVMRNIFSQLF